MTREALRLRAEAIAARLGFALFGALPVDIASAFGGWLGRTIGYRLPVTRRARSNLARAMPELDEGAREALLTRMWDNLGRTVAEFAHIEAMCAGPDRRIEAVGAEHATGAYAKGRGVLFFSAHLGNWEVFGPFATGIGVPLNLVYRAPNNAALDWMLQTRVGEGAEMIPKGARGARRVLELLRAGKALGLLVDQKMNDGIEAPFFGRPAMTAPALAQLALKFRCPVVPAHVERLGGARLRVVIDPPLVLPAIADRHEAIRAITAQVNGIVEGWIRARPEQWLWLHRRWPD